MKRSARGFGLAARLITLAAAVIVAVAAVNVAVFVAKFKGSAEEAMTEEAAAFTAVADETKNHQSFLISQNAVRMDEMLAEATEQLKKGTIRHF